MTEPRTAILPGDGSDVAKLNVYQRMAIAQNHFRYVQKERPKGLQYAVVLHDAVAAKARSALLAARLYAKPTVEEHGQDGRRTWARVRTDYINIDDPEDRFSVTMFGHGDDSMGKGPGAAISYATKYCHLKAFGVETGEDADLQNVESLQGETTSEDEHATSNDDDDLYGSEADRADLYDSIVFAIEKSELDSDYVRARMTAGAGKMTWAALLAASKSISENPDLWRED